MKFMALLRASCILAPITLLAACTQVGPYRTDLSSVSVQATASLDGKPLINDKHALIDYGDGTLNYKIGVVEFDEFGHLFNRNQMNDVVSQIGSLQKPPIIVVFVHGWHHNASIADENFNAFSTKVLMHIAETEARTRNPSRPVVGVYVGWRGESISADPVNVLTFWDRKNTAHSVGNGDVIELFLRLRNLRYGNKGWQRNNEARLVFIGHSFGGAVTYSALMHSIIEQLVDGETPRPFGDLVALLNPAFEAMRFRPLFELSQSRTYASDQQPIFVSITSEADAATRLAFPAGRYLSTMFNDYLDKVSYEMDTTAIGHYLPFITHELTISNDVADAQDWDERCNKVPRRVMRSQMSIFGMTGVPAMAYEFVKWIDGKTKSNTFVFNYPGHMRRCARATQLTRCDVKGDCINVAGDHFIEKGDVKNGRAPLSNPIINIRTSGDVISGHNDIWNDTIQSFLEQFVAASIYAPASMPLAPPAH